MIRRAFRSLHLDAVSWRPVVAQGVMTAVVVLVAAGFLSAHFNERQDTTRGTLVQGCERTRDRNAFLRVKLRPTPLQAVKYLPLLDCEATTDAGGRPVPASPTVVQELLAQALRGR